jgi:hypothetical protein
VVETKSLKALAFKVLERNAARNAERNGLLITVSDTPKREDRDETPAPERIIEAIFTTAPTPTYCAAAFPPCPVCGSVRYWLASGGRVLCGTKQCASALRFQLIALEFHAVN